MNVLECVVEFIRKTEPGYFYKGPMDFVLFVDSEGKYSFQDWNLSFERPDIEECMKLVPVKREQNKCIISVVKEAEEIVGAVEGSLALINGELSIFLGGTWTPI